MISVSIYSENPFKTYALKYKGLKLTRRYEDNDYSFVASDTKFDALEAREIYNDLIAGRTVYLTIKHIGNFLFRGIFQNEGNKYDPEKEIYSLSAAHISKKIFMLLKMTMEERVKQSITFSDILTGTFPSHFNSLLFWSHNNLRDRYVDMAKHYRCIMYINDARRDDGKEELVFIPRKELEADTTVLNVDDYLAEYNEVNKNSDFKKVCFPAFLKFDNSGSSNSVQHPYYAFGVWVFYDGKKLTPYVLVPDEQFIWYHQIISDESGIIIGTEKKLTTLGLQIQNMGAIFVTDPATVNFDETLDLRTVFKDFTSFGSHPNQQDIPIYNEEELLLDCEYHYKKHVTPYMEVTSKLRELLPIDLYKKIRCNGKTIDVRDIEYDLEKMDMTVTGKNYQ